MKKHKYKYLAKILKIIDGDTIKAELDLGLSIKSIQTLRLARINSPELRGPMRKYGLEAKEALENWQSLVSMTDSLVEIETSKQGKYGRYIAEVLFRLRPENEMVNLSDWLVEQAFAEYKDY
tara:strand:- start:465 stop:830 length:366 start_codon:yes stop_codon:yes gene_type:complete